MKAVLVAVVLLWGGSAYADAYLRVIAQKAPVHSGPSNGYRELAVGEHA